MQGKTQLFPGHESDFFRNRLTHSLEVAQIAESIARKLNATEKYLQGNPINERICYAAALLHDIGHPPFGHNGEDALDEKMVEYGGFEGNAQTLRIVSQLEKKVVKPGDFDALERRCGLNLTYRMLAAILKYDQVIPEKRAAKTREHAEKGYYFEDKPVVDDIKQFVADDANLPFEFKSIECAIMDLADDIAYSTYDLEDSFKAGFLNPRNVLAAPPDVLDRVAKKVAKVTESEFTAPDAWDIFMDMFITHVDDERYEENIDSDDYSITAKLANAIWLTSEINTVAEDGRIRTEFTSSLVGEFVDSVSFELNDRFPALSKISVPLKTGCIPLPYVISGAI